MARVLHEPIRFSVVVTTFNRERMLRRTIESVLGQTVACELVVVDDHSSDGTQDYLEELVRTTPQSEGRRVVCHVNETNVGQSMATNTGVELASGNWIKLVDDDDYLAPHCIERLTRTIERHPDVVICSCRCYKVGADGAPLGFTPLAGPGPAFYVPQEDIHYGMLLELLPFGTPVQVAFRRDAFLKTGGWDPHLDVGDADSWAKISNHGDAIFINEPVAYRTVWPGSRDRVNSLYERFERNVVTKQRIHPFVSTKHRQNAPSLAAVVSYLRLYWALVAIRGRDLKGAWRLASRAVCSVSAWRLLIGAVLFRLGVFTHTRVRRVAIRP